jgi:hypothetical protein
MSSSQLSLLLSKFFDSQVASPQCGDAPKRWLHPPCSGLKSFSSDNEPSLQRHPFANAKSLKKLTPWKSPSAGGKSDAPCRVHVACSRRVLLEIVGIKGEQTATHAT